MIQIGKNPADDRIYKIDEAAKEIGFPFGRSTLYKILKKLKIIESNNAPRHDLVEKGYLKLAEPELTPNPYFYTHPVTLVNGAKGLEFIKLVVDDYLKTNPIPKVTRQKRNYITSNKMI